MKPLTLLAALAVGAVAMWALLTVDMTSNSELKAKGLMAFCAVSNDYELLGDCPP